MSKIKLPTSTDSVAGILVEDRNETTALTNRKIPRCVARAKCELTKLKEVLVTSKRLADMTNVTYGTFMLHTRHPVLIEHRVDQNGRVYWGNAQVAARIRKEQTA